MAETALIEKPDGRLLPLEQTPIQTHQTVALNILIPMIPTLMLAPKL